MNIVVRRYYAKSPAAADQMIVRVREKFLPIVRAIPGFSEYLAINTGQGQLLFVTICQDASAAQASTRAAAQYVTSELSEFVSGGPEVIEGGVEIHERA
jgi:hypothetical protein